MWQSESVQVKLVAAHHAKAFVFAERAGARTCSTAPIELETSRTPEVRVASCCVQKIEGAGPGAIHRYSIISLDTISIITVAIILIFHTHFSQIHKRKRRRRERIKKAEATYRSGAFILTDQMYVRRSDIDAQLSNEEFCSLKIQEVSKRCSQASDNDQWYSYNDKRKQTDEEKTQKLTR